MFNYVPNAPRECRPCIKNGKPDIELIVEQSEIFIVPRPGLSKQTCLDASLPRIDRIMFVDGELSSDMPMYKLTLAEEISHRLLEPELWEKGVPEGADIFDLDADAYDHIEGDAYRLALAILMPQQVFVERFNCIKSELVADKCNGALDSLAVEMLNKEFQLTFNACASRGRHLGICQADLKKRQLPGAVVL
jgi:Zn-dependent peptidase ImmA (M78 family)